jgi:hypothetical protein
VETSESTIEGECMRVAIVSTPRTCSSMLGTLFSTKFNLTDYSELFSEGPIVKSVEEKLDMMTNTDDFSVKITSTTLTSYKNILDYQTFPWHAFDRIVLAERLDITQQAASWLLLSYAQENGNGEYAALVEFLTEQLKTPENIPLDRSLLKYILETILYYYDVIKPHLLKSGLHVSMVDHEMMQKPSTEYLPELNERLGIEFTQEDVDKISNPTYIDYTPFIEAHKLRDVIEEIKQELTNATKEETSTDEGNESIENEGTV